MWVVAAQSGALDLRGTRSSLTELAVALEHDAAHAVLRRPPSVAADERALRSIEIVPAADPDQPVELRVGIEELVVYGGAHTRRLLAEGIRNLSEAPFRVTENSVPTHLDVSFFPGHPYLADGPYWLTAFVVHD